MSFRSKYNLADIMVGETKYFATTSSVVINNIRRSAHNYNQRTDMFFSTRVKDGVIYVTRLR